MEPETERLCGGKDVYKSLSLVKKAEGVTDGESEDGDCDVAD